MSQAFLPEGPPWFGCSQNHDCVIDPKQSKSLRMQPDFNNFDECWSHILSIHSAAVIFCTIVWGTVKAVQEKGVWEKRRTSLESWGYCICHSCNNDCHCIVVNAPLVKNFPPSGHLVARISSTSNYPNSLAQVTSLNRLGASRDVPKILASSFIDHLDHSTLLTENCWECWAEHGQLTQKKHKCPNVDFTEWLFRVCDAQAGLLDTLPTHTFPKLKRW